MAGAGGGRISRAIRSGGALVGVSALEGFTPFLRMFLLSHFLNLRELGFSVALTATVGLLEQATDFALSRFVLTVPRAEFAPALASAHALAVLRGLVVGLIALAAAPFVASFLSLGADWPAFAALAGLFVIRGFENLAPRVWERDYRYGAQLKANLLATLCSLAVLVVALMWRANHIALLMALYVQALVFVSASWLLSDAPYRLSFRSRHFAAGFRFGYPLTINGLGLALATHGDRFVVGAMLDLPALGVYSVVSLVVYVPIYMISRVISSGLLAAMHNASEVSQARRNEVVRLAARAMPLVAGLYALGILTLMNFATPLVFGPRFVVSHAALVFLAAFAFVRLLRDNPFSTLLLQQGRTRRMALANVSSMSAIGFEVALLYAFASFAAVFLGKFLGEAVALVVTLQASARNFPEALRDFTRSAAAVLAGLGAVVGLIFAFGLSERVGLGAAVLALGFAAAAVWALRNLLPALRALSARRAPDQPAG